MEYLIGFAIFVWIVWGLAFSSNGKSKIFSGGPIVHRSTGGYESHLDFLEMHGCISAEDRKADREFEREYEEHPERFTTYSLEEFMKLNGSEE